MQDLLAAWRRCPKFLKSIGKSRHTIQENKHFPSRKVIQQYSYADAVQDKLHSAICSIPMITSLAEISSSRGVISETDPINDAEEDTKEALRAQNIIQVQRITIKRNKKIIPTKHFMEKIHVEGVLALSIKTEHSPK
ncbi:hypothetical protein CDAR_607041 [Caerostris darwini]|uniref:Uncharacterized protein n=1 Tax=Caerostris darwini TaxID=1538125 RepID=A0AAV4R2E7_9ARAC|nr:hypothetical protein CDAR_607041 [Caerostris darwini]